MRPTDRPLQSPLPVFLVLLAFSSSLASADGTFSLTSLAQYSSQRKCVQSCFGGFSDLGNALKCSYPTSDGCVCNAASTNQGSFFLSSCVNKLCSSNAADVSNAASLYGDYCDGGLPLAYATTVQWSFVTGYGSLSYCAKACIWNGVEAMGMGCGNLADCMCRTDLTSLGSNALQTCINSACSGDSTQITSAVQVYTDYCNNKEHYTGVTTAPAAFKTTSNKAQQGSTVKAPGATSTSSSNDPGSGGNNSSRGGLSPGVTAALAIASLLVAVIGVWIAWRQLREAKKRKQMAFKPDGNAGHVQTPPYYYNSPQPMHQPVNPYYV